MQYDKKEQAWTPFELGELVSLVNGRGFKSTEWSLQGLPIIRISNLNGDQEFNYYNGEFKEQHRVSKGDLLFSWSGNRGTSFGPFIWKGKDGLLNQHIFKVLINEKVDHQYLYYTLKQLTQKIEKSAHGGSGLVHVKKSDLEQVQILVPPLYEQQKIAEILSSVDEAIEKTEAIIKQTETVKKGLMQQLLTKGIGHTEFKQTQVGYVPSQWEITKIQDISNIIDCKHYTPQYVDQGVSIVRTNDIRFGNLDLSKTKYTSEEDYRKLTDKYTPQLEDIVYGREGSFGVASYVARPEKFSIGQRVVLIRAKNEVLSKYFFYILNSKIVYTQVLEVSLGTTVKRVNVKDLKNVLIPLPSKDEQEKIILILDEIFNKLNIERIKLQKLTELKKGLFSVLLTGKTRVNVDQPEVLT